MDDAINCCIASSHIPYITGNNFLNKYQDINAFDGGFSKYPYLNIIKPTLHISPNIWNDNDTSQDQKNNAKTYIEKLLRMSTKISDYTTLFSRNQYDFLQLYDNGYEDAKKNKAFLDKTFGSS